MQIREADILAGDQILEIGPGLGFLTEELLKTGAQITAIEIDPNLYRYLKGTLENRYDNLKLIHGDFLKEEFQGFNKVIANLPYNISSPITFRLHGIGIELGVLMYQYEFAQRMCSEPNCKEYSRLSVMCQYHFFPTLIRKIGSNVFYPQPDVDSALVRLVRRKRKTKAQNYDIFKNIVRSAFNKRRKKLKNALGSLGEIELKKMETESTMTTFLEKRAGELSVENYISIANHFSTNKDG
jgi:16S rRNA (adenine1518-N6/adenine1519-N6)-dimethyltransferase